MQAYNHGILVESSSENFDRQKLANEIFVRVRANGVDFTDLSKCISCHACEKRCTQKLDIANRLHEMFEMAQAYGYTKENMYKRLTEIELECSENGKVGIWPAADYATRVLDFWNNPKFESRCEFFNSSEELWGKEYRGKHILSPSELDSSQVNTVIIMHYRLQDEIYNDLQNMCEANNLTIKLVKLHSANEIDWFNRMV
jgi:heterodisulfide reductase subunit C